MKIEQNYDLRQELLTVHKQDLRDLTRKPNPEEYWLADGASIAISPAVGEVIAVSAEDFTDFLSVSMKLSAKVVTEGPADITVRLASERCLL